MRLFLRLEDKQKSCAIWVGYLLPVTLVLSPKAFNRLGITLIAPFTQGGNFARVEGFTVTLMGLGTDTQGVILINGIRMLDLIARKATKIEIAPPEIVDEVLAILATVIDFEAN